MITALQIVALVAMGFALCGILRHGKSVIPRELWLPLLTLAFVGLVKYSLNALEWSGLLVINLDTLEDYLDSLWPIAWFFLFFSARILLSRMELEQVNLKLTSTLEKLRISQDQATRDQRLKAMGRMASGIAHDFNNNLQPILGYTELLANEDLTKLDRKKVDQAFSRIIKSVHNAAETVRRIRVFYSQTQSSGTPSIIDPCESIREAVMTTKVIWKDQALSQGRTIDMQLELHYPGTIQTMVDGFQDILSNLIFNAVEALPQGGTVTLRCDQQGSDFILEVEDNGVGMDRETLDHCLDPFFTTKSNPGSGLGLSNIYGITRAMGADLSIDSEPGRGTRVTITIPQNGSGELYDSVIIESECENLTILLVDDEEMVRGAVAEQLKRKGHVVSESSCAEEARRAFRAQHYDVVVTDKAMPGESGLELAKSLKELRPECPVIMLTGFGAIIAAQSELPDCIDCLLSKPVSSKKLHKAIQQLCSRQPLPENA